MKNVLKFFMVILLIFAANSILSVSSTMAKQCYKADFGGYVDIGGTQVFVCPGLGNTPCLYLSDCDEQ